MSTICCSQALLKIAELVITLLDDLVFLSQSCVSLANEVVFLLETGISFVTRMQRQSVAWLANRVLAIYGEYPNDPALFSWWFASVLPVTEEEKYRLLGTSSVRARLKIEGRTTIV